MHRLIWEALSSIRSPGYLKVISFISETDVTVEDVIGSEPSGPPVQVSGGFDFESRTVSFDLTVHMDRELPTEFSLATGHLGSDESGLGLSLGDSGQISARGAVDLQLSAGVDLSRYFDDILQLQAPSVRTDDIYIELDHLRAAAIVAVSDLEFGLALGDQQNFGVEDAALSVHAVADIQLVDPNGDGRLTLAEFQAANSVADLVTFGTDVGIEGSAKLLGLPDVRLSGDYHLSDGSYALQFDTPVTWTPAPGFTLTDALLTITNRDENGTIGDTRLDVQGRSEISRRWSRLDGRYSWR